MACFLYWAGGPSWESPLPPSFDDNGTLVFTGFECEMTSTCGWVIAEGENLDTTWAKYITSFYYSFTIMSTVGFGDHHAHNPTERFITLW